MDIDIEKINLYNKLIQNILDSCQQLSTIRKGNQVWGHLE